MIILKNHINLEITKNFIEISSYGIYSVFYNNKSHS